MKKPPVCIPDPHAGIISPEALKAPPWADGRMPTSQRTGRRAAYSTAQRDYNEALDSIPVSEENMRGGFWDHDQERAMGPRRGPAVPERYDRTAMDAFFLASGNSLSANEWEVYKLFWERHMSYGAVARKLGTNRDRVYECIKRLRAKCARRLA
jgi:hypothetical protein